jgi:hypothetical protein
LTSASAKRAQRPLYFLIFSTVLLLMNARWKRFAEYFPPFAILFAAFSLESLWQGRAIFTRLPQDVLADLQPFLDRQETAEAEKEKKSESNWQLLKAVFVSGGVGSGLVRKCLSHVERHSRKRPARSLREGRIVDARQCARR